MPEDKGKAEIPREPKPFGEDRYSYLYTGIEGACCQVVKESKAPHASMARESSNIHTHRGQQSVRLRSTNTYTASPWKPFYDFCRYKEKAEETQEKFSGGIDRKGGRERGSEARPAPLKGSVLKGSSEWKGSVCISWVLLLNTDVFTLKGSSYKKRQSHLLGLV